VIILAATWLWYYVASGRIDIVGILGTANHGILLDPPLALESLALTDAQGEAVSAVGERPVWQILLPGRNGCDAACSEAVHYTRQIHSAMGKYANRIERLLVTSRRPDERLAKDYPKLKLRYTSASGMEALEGAAPAALAPAYFLVDPAGWVILSYTADADGKDVMADLKFLLKNSN
jgi:hypothetical protein